MVAYVYDFTEGSRDQAGLLGGKGANLAEMTRLGLPVPPGFTITTEACRAFLTTGELPQELGRQVVAHLRRLEERAGRRLGQADDPLLLSVRSGARFSMPGMMDTILDVGLNDTTVHGLAKRSGRERFAWDSYRRLVQMYGSTVMGVDGALFEEALTHAKRERDTTDDLGLGTRDLARLVTEFKAIVRGTTGTDFPQDPDEQLERSVLAVFRSWNGERARVYRRRERIPDDLGTAVNVQAMVYGNLGPDSGTGVAFTRDPANGRAGVYGEYLPDAQGEDVVAGIRNAVPLQELRNIDSLSYERLLSHMALLEEQYRDLCDVEFTIERGRLWMLQTRVGKRTPQAAFRIAAELVDEGRITWADALRRVGGGQLTQLMFPRFDERAASRPLTRGIPASPGAAVGQVVFDSAEAVRRAGSGERVVLVREETTPDDLPGMIAAQAVLTSRGGKTSHAAVVARGMGKVCVCGAEHIQIDLVRRRFTTGEGWEVTEGTVISVDGAAGTVHLGALPLVDSPVMRYLETGERSAGPAEAVDRMLRQADAVARLEVRANADTPEDAARARRFGARGIGLCRTEHMFLGKRRYLVEDMILARTGGERQSALDALLPLQRADFTEILAAMDGLPVTIRLLDPPLHEFLPDRTELAVDVASAKAAGRTPDAREVRLLKAVERMREQNPMLGLRGVRLALVVPGLTAMQVRALGEAVVARVRAGGDPRAEIMVPLVGTHEELRVMREQIETALSDVFAAADCAVDCPVGTMIELPRAALTAAGIARYADFFSFGTNDLTQTTWGFSRDDAEASFFAPYLDQGILSASPFEKLDEDGVGRLIRMAVDEGRGARPDIKIGVCGEHGGEPDSIRFFHAAGLDYVSCSPFRVPGARLEAARAALPSADRDEGRGAQA
ncbi:pyruvate phosphate dikinase [Streptomyces griseoflavus]|uniref:pyruvate, phosphate dikinase n=1 Tax=Streptomyces rimosus TaxID=1927 RepID=UPI0004C4C644|nr:pyruvate, phosphate dikinase [Streptomyces rimosus]KOG54747.1 pyruvate phosphate dikinase [Streptomyces griseoflavus]